MKRVMIAVALFVTGCQKSDGERLAGIGRAVTRNVEQLVPERTPLGSNLSINPGIDQRVRDRFKSDRYLSTQPIDVHSEGATVRLQGTVAESALKRRAVELAESTVGVDAVVDELTVAK